MLRWTIRMVRRGLVVTLTGLAVSGAALAQSTAPTSSTPSSLPAPSAASPPAITVTPAPNQAAGSPPTQAAPLLTQAQLEQLVAPIALYPDPLLAQILMASTYPLEVVEAARWVSVPASRGLTGEVMTTSLQAQNWDPSIKALVPFPRVLENMSNQLEWTQALGNAFLAQQADVMAAVQVLRQQAMAAGNLKETPQCRCSIHASGNIISIVPVEPQVVCVPVYSPVVYGAWPYPAYPPDYFPVPVGFAYAPGFWIGFGPPIRLAVFGSFWGWGWVDWGHRYIAVDPGRYALASGGRPSFAGNVWVHDPAHRGGIAYADAATRTRFDAARASALTMGARAGAGRNGMTAGRTGGAARFASARGEVAHSGAGRFGAPMHGGAPAYRHQVGIHGAAAFHGGAAFRGGTEFRGASAAGGGGAASHAGLAEYHGGGGHQGGGSHSGGAPHFTMGGSHGSGAGPHGGGSPRGGGGSRGGGAQNGGGGDHHG